MKAVIKTGGKQYYVAEGDVIYIEKLDAKVGDEVVFNEVLMHGNKIGNPYVKGASVIGEVTKEGKQKKIKIFTYKSKDRSNRKRQGHRQPYTQVSIKSIKA